MALAKNTIKDIDVSGKRVLVRVDYNVPLDSKGAVADDFKIRQQLPTLRYLLEQGASVIVCSHLGRPEGRPQPSLSLFPVAKHLQQLLQHDVSFVPACTGERVDKAIESLRPGGVVMLENLRFEPGEEQNDDEFAQVLAGYANVFVQDGFAVTYRRHASVDAITRHLPSVAGLLLEEELKALNLADAPMPLVAIVGGESLIEKVPLLERLIRVADVVAVGGGVGYAFLQAAGVKLGTTVVQPQDIPLAKELLRLAAAERQDRRFLLYLPQDGVVTDRVFQAARLRIVDWSAHVIADIEHYPKRTPHAASVVASDETVVDIGPFSGSFIAGLVQMADTVLWSGLVGDALAMPGANGPVGPYAHGSELILEAMTGQFGNHPRTIIAGDDTVDFVRQRHVASAFDHVSTGGGASLEVLAGRRLPGVDGLQGSGDSDEDEGTVDQV